MDHLSILVVVGFKLAELRNFSVFEIINKMTIEDLKKEILK